MLRPIITVKVHKVDEIFERQRRAIDAVILENKADEWRREKGHGKVIGQTGSEKYKKKPGSRKRGRSLTDYLPWWGKQPDQGYKGRTGSLGRNKGRQIYRAVPSNEMRRRKQASHDERRRREREGAARVRRASESDLSSPSRRAVAAATTRNPNLKTYKEGLLLQLPQEQLPRPLSSNPTPNFGSLPRHSWQQASDEALRAKETFVFGSE